MKYKVGHHSLRGARSSNQDRVAYAERDNAIFMVLADGLGGHAGGSIASEIMTKWSIQAFQSIKQPIITQPSAFLAFAILEAHDQMVAYTKAKFPDMQPRTTCVLCLVQNGYAYWAHVGDSRLYHFRNDKVLERTHDHSTVEKMFQKGLIKEEDMRTHPQKNHVTRCVGGSQKPEVELGKETRLEPGDRLLLCSDGVWEAFESSEMTEFMRLDPLEEGIEEMLHAAEDKMQHVCDNITAIGLNWHDIVTTSEPLQGLDTVNFNPDKAVKYQKKKPDAQKIKKIPKKEQAQTGKESTAQMNKESVQQNIEDLEAYLDFHQKKLS